MPDADQPELNVVSVPSILTSTPEGREMVKRLQEKDEELEDRLREMGGQAAVDEKHCIERAYEEAVLFGKPPEPQDGEWDNEISVEPDHPLWTPDP